MSVSLYGDVHEISIKSGGTQKLTVNAGTIYMTSHAVPVVLRN
jgi:hypothetical protein